MLSFLVEVWVVKSQDSPCPAACLRQISPVAITEVHSALCYNLQDDHGGCEGTGVKAYESHTISIQSSMFLKICPLPAYLWELLLLQLSTYTCIALALYFLKYIINLSLKNHCIVKDQ